MSPSRTRPTLLALASAALFGLSVPVSKTLLRGVGPAVLAALFYGAMGASLAAAVAVRRPLPAPFRGRERWTLAAVAAVGGVAAPLLLLHGLRLLEGQSASILLALEGAFTAVLAAAFFREHVGRAAWAAVALALGGGLVLAEPWKAAGDGPSGAGVLLVAGATLCAALDNNLSRLLSAKDPVLVAAGKGLLAGPVLLGAALLLGGEIPSDAGTLAAAAGVGVVSFGISLSLFLSALRELGAARTTALFSTAPVFGAAASWAALGENPGPATAAAAALLAGSVWVLARERAD